MKLYQLRWHEGCGHVFSSQLLALTFMRGFIEGKTPSQETKGKTDEEVLTLWNARVGLNRAVTIVEFSVDEGVQPDPKVIGATVRYETECCLVRQRELVEQTNRLEREYKNSLAQQIKVTDEYAVLVERLRKFPEEFEAFNWGKNLK